MRKNGCFLLLASILTAPFTTYAQDDVMCSPTQCPLKMSNRRLLVLPFQNVDGRKDTQYLTLGLALILAERLEAEPKLRLINGPLVLTAEQAASGREASEASLVSLAQATGADTILTGRYSGDPEHWSLTTELFAVIDGRLRPIGQGEASGNQITTVIGKSGKKLSAVSMANIQVMLAVTTASAFAQADRPLSPDMVADLYRPSTRDSWAFIQLSRAYAKLLLPAVTKTGAPQTDPHSRGTVTALGIAEYAVRVDPKYYEAQRLYAYLLGNAADTARARNKARIHYEEALKIRGNDIRVLMPLGRLEAVDGNHDIARKYLGQAIAINPNDAEPHYWLGKTLAGLDESAGAIAELEKARNLNSFHLEARRELVRLYSADKRYGDAILELKIIVAAAPQDSVAALELAACLRANGQWHEAAIAYQEAAARFPQDARPLKFLGDLLVSQGSADEARSFYALALIRNRRDPRLSAYFNGRNSAPVLPLGGLDLLEAIKIGTDNVSEMEALRPRFQDAANDVVLTLAVTGKKGCDTAAASAALAKRTLASYAGHGRVIADTAAALRASLQNGDDASLTSDERAAATAATAYSARAVREWREMLSLYRKSALPTVRRADCQVNEKTPLADYAAVAARNRHRLVDLPKVQPPRWTSNLSPEVPTYPERPVNFTLINRSEEEYQVILDGDDKRANPIPAGKAVTLITSQRSHRVCVAPTRRPACGHQNDLEVLLHENWTMTIKPGSR